MLLDLSTDDATYMRLALQEAVKGRGSTSPNPLVGAVAVKNGKVLGSSFHEKYGFQHAEISLLEKLASADAEGSTIYVNLEPCCHYGKTAPCTDALIKAKVSRVVIGHEDPNPLVSGKGIQQLKNLGIEVKVGVTEQEAKKINAPFITYMTEKRPWILLKTAQSLDGRIALSNGKSRWITGFEARKEVHRLRSEFDAVVVGSKTIIDDNPELTVRHIEGRNPKRVIFDSKLSLDIESKIFKQKDIENTWIVTTKNADSEKKNKIEQMGVSVIVAETDSNQKIDIQNAVEKLASKGILSVFLEGGGTLHASFIRSNLFDKVIIALAPMLIGQDGRASIGNLGLTEIENAPHFSFSEIRKVGQDIWIEMERDVYRDR